MNKIASYSVALQSSPLWDDASLMKLAADLRAEDYAAAKTKAQIAAGLHAAGHLPTGVGLLPRIAAGYQQRSALRDANIDYHGGGEGTFGAEHPILSGFIPFAGTVSAVNAADRIARRERAARKREG